MNKCDIDIAKQLNNQASHLKVRVSIKKLKNSKIPGPDQVANELLKFSGGVFVKYYTKIINAAFERGTDIAMIGEKH